MTPTSAARPVIRVIFSERINPITLNPTSFYLYNSHTGGLVRTTIAIAPDRLSADVAAGRATRADCRTITTLCRRSRTWPATQPVWEAIYFRTGTVEDTTPPTLVSIDPTNGATNVPVNARVQVVLSESIDTTSCRHPRCSSPHLPLEPSWCQPIDEHCSSLQPRTWPSRRATPRRSAGCAILPATRCLP